MDCFLYDWDLRHESVNHAVFEKLRCLKVKPELTFYQEELHVQYLQ